MGDLLDGYDAGPAWDEMFDRPGSTRPPYDALRETLEALAHGRGVCQDFAHLSLAVLRASDVAPLKGVYQGGRATSHRVSVELTRLA